MNFYSLTNQGLVRSSNQDAHAHFENDFFSIFVLCDGMGGHQAGEVASHLAVDTVIEFFTEKSEEKDYADLLLEAVSLANQAVYAKGQSSPQYHNMGTTIVALLIAKTKAYIAHIGDSRLYLMRDSELRQITEDHSLVQNLVNKGLMTKEDARHSPEKSALTRALGIDPEEKTDLDLIDLKAGDQLLLCSDGLSNMVEEEEIACLLKSEAEPREKAEKLMSMAIAGGGKDNITLTLLSY